MWPSRAFIRIVLLNCLLIFLWNAAHPQGSSDYGKGLKVNFDEVDNKFIRFVLWNQFWAGPIQNNPGTIINGEPSSTTFNYGARRMRILAHTQISPRYLIVMHFGVNNQTFASGGGSGTSGTGAYGAGKKPQLFFHDVYNEYAIIPLLDPLTGEENDFHFYAGAGLHYWNGISRLTSGSTLNMLMVDAPVFNWPTVDISDQFGRQFGFYAKGGYKKLNYQFHINKPFITSAAPLERANIAVDNNGDPNTAFGGYVDYQFLEKESQVLPFRVGTYVGTKRVFNIGAGFYQNGDATKSSTPTGELKKHDINLLGLDLFTDLPIGKPERNMAVTLYAVYYNFQFGPNYLRTTGICNPGILDVNGTPEGRVLEGAGNSRVLLGTGQIWYAQGGLLLPKPAELKLRVQPVAAFAYKKIEQLRQAGAFWDIGTNFYLDGHHAKMTIQYSSRPLYDANTKWIKDRKGELIIQFQIYL
jgi:hypothetical protein